jgi:hypothetical protein
MNTDLLLDLADYFFLTFHSALIVFNLFGWIWKPSRKWHLLTISLTFVSWTLLGIWYGWGYCPLTDWHWDILREKGVTGLPDSYISYLIERILGFTLSPEIVDILTLGLALLALIFSIYFNFQKNTRSNP